MSITQAKTEFALKLRAEIDDLQKILKLIETGKEPAAAPWMPTVPEKALGIKRKYTKKSKFWKKNGK